MAAVTNKENSLKIGLPAGMSGRISDKYSSGEYYQITNPWFKIPNGFKFKTKTIGLGSNRSKAISRAEKLIFGAEVYKIFLELKQELANSAKHIYQIDKPFIQVVFPIKVNSIAELCDHYIASVNIEVAYGEKGGSTANQIEGYIDEIKCYWHESYLNYMDTANIQAHLDKYRIHGKGEIKLDNENNPKNLQRAANALRATYVDLLNYGLRYKLINFVNNPADATKKLKVKIKRSNCSIDVFNTVVNRCLECGDTHYALAFELALVTKLRLTDLLLIRKTKGFDYEDRRIAFIRNRNYGLSKEVSFNDRVEHAPYSFVDDENQEITVFQQKTGQLIRIPFSQRASEKHCSVGQLINKISMCCNADSEFLLHHPKNKGRAKVGSPINNLSKLFKKHIRSLEVNWLGLNPTCFAEIRNLGAKMFDDYSGPQQNRKKNTASKVCSTVDESVKYAQCSTENVSASLGHVVPKTKEIYLKTRGLAPR